MTKDCKWWEKREELEGAYNAYEAAGYVDATECERVSAELAAIDHYRGDMSDYLP